MNIHEQRLRALVREEIIKKNSNVRSHRILNEATESDIIDVQNALGIPENGDVGTVWGPWWDFLQDNYRQWVYVDGQDLSGLTSAIPSLQSVYDDWEDQADDLGYPPGDPSSMAEFIRAGGQPRAGSPAHNEYIERVGPEEAEPTLRGTENIIFDQGFGSVQTGKVKGDWEVKGTSFEGVGKIILTFDENGFIEDNAAWSKIVGGVVDSLESWQLGGRDDDSIFSTWNVIQAIKDYSFFDKTEEVVILALAQLDKNYAASSDGGESIADTLQAWKDALVGSGVGADAGRKRDKMIQIMGGVDPGVIEDATELAKAALSRLRRGGEEIGERVPELPREAVAAKRILNVIRSSVRDVLLEGTLDTNTRDVPPRGGSRGSQEARGDDDDSAVGDDDWADNGDGADDVTTADDTDVDNDGTPDVDERPGDPTSDSDTPRSRRYTDSKYWPSQVVKDIQAIVGAPSCSRSRGCDGMWGPRTQGSWESHLERKFEELGEDWKDISHKAMWPDMSRAVSVIAGETFAGNPEGALLFLRHIGGLQSTREAEVETEPVPTTVDTPQGSGPLDREVRRDASGRTVERELFPGSVASSSTEARVHRYIPRVPIMYDYMGSALRGPGQSKPEEKIKRVVVVMDTKLPLNNETAGFSPDGSWVGSNSDVAEIRMFSPFMRRYRRNHPGHKELLRWIKDEIGWEHFNV